MPGLSYVIGYYVHHHGLGHLTRARCIADALDEPVTVLSSLAAPENLEPFAGWVNLSRDDGDPHGRDHEAGRALHWAPLIAPGYQARMAAIAEWTKAQAPSVVVVDVSVEVAALVRLLGVPVVVMQARESAAMPLTSSAIDLQARSSHRGRRRSTTPSISVPMRRRRPTWVHSPGSILAESHSFLTANGYLSCLVQGDRTSLNGSWLQPDRPRPAGAGTGSAAATSRGLTTSGTTSSRQTSSSHMLARMSLPKSPLPAARRSCSRNRVRLTSSMRRPQRSTRLVSLSP